MEGDGVGRGSDQQLGTGVFLTSRLHQLPTGYYYSLSRSVKTMDGGAVLKVKGTVQQDGSGRN